MTKVNPSDEILSLLNRIEEASTSSVVSLTEVLRLCMRLGKQLDNQELIEWAQNEASGYDDANDLPDYRKISSESRGDFYGPFGSGVKNAHIPNSAIEKGHREILCNVYMFEPVAELEALTTDDNSGGGSLQVMWSGDLIAYYQQKEMYTNGLRLASAWRIMTKQKLTGVLETIRTRVLNFVLKIEEELEINDSSKKTAKDSKTIGTKNSTVTQIFHNTIYGGNLSQGSNAQTSQVSMNINVEEKNIKSLKQYLKQLGIQDKDLEELEVALNKDGEYKKKPGPAVSSWIAKTTLLGIKGGLSVASNVAGSLIAGAIMKYYGVS